MPKVIKIKSLSDFFCLSLFDHLMDKKIRIKAHDAISLPSSIYLVFLLLTCAYSLTDLTNINCPSGFNITEANQTLASSSITQFFFSVYNNPTYNDRVNNIVIYGDTEDLSALINQMMLPFIVIAAAFFIVYMTIICCVMFQKSCPPCQSWKRDFMKRPYQKFELRCVLIFTLIFAFIVFVLSIVIFTTIPEFSTQMKYAQCSLYNGLDVTLNGDTSKNWGGFATLKNQVGNISSLLTTASGQVTTYFKGANGLSNDDWLIDNMATMLKANFDLYNNNRDAQVITPNSVTTASAVTGGNPLPLVNSVFIQTGLGPNGTANTMVTDIDVGLRQTQKLSNQAYLVQKAANILVDSANTVQANTQSAQQTLSMYQSNLISVQAQIDKFNAQYFSLLFDWGIYVIEGIVGFILAASLIIILGVVSTHIFDIFACKSMVNLGWAIYGITYFGVIALVFVFLSLGSVGYTFCTYYDSMINSQASFNKLGEAYSQNVFTKLDVCLYGDGNVLQKFSLANEMKTVTNLFTNIQTYFDYQDSSSINYIDPTFSTTKIQNWINAMQKYKLGIYIDSNPSLTTQDNPNFALSKLNLYTNGGSLVPNCTRDDWVFDSSNCSSTFPAAQVYAATNSVANGLTITTVDDLCISFNQKLSNAQSSSWSQSDFTSRYIQIKQNCGPAYDQIIARGQALINYRDSRYNLFQGLSDQLTSLHTLNTQFNTDMVQYSGRVSTFYSSVSALNNLVTDQISGLLVTSDCRVISNQMKFTYNVLCVNAIPQVATIGLCCIILLLVMIPGMITSSVFSVRFARIQKSQKLVKRIVIPETSLHSETFQKRAQSSDSSSSSEQD